MDPEELDTQGQDLETTDTGGTPAPGGDGQDGEAVGSATEALLDSLSAGGDVEQQQRQRDPLGRFVATDAAPATLGAAPIQQPAAAASAAPAATAKPAAPPSPDQEDAELLAGIKSERGRARVQQIIEARKEAEGEVAAVRELVHAAGMTAETFSQHIEFSRLANSNDPRDLQQAAQMLEQTRADLYRRLGQDAPGVDALSDFPDLAQQVQNMAMPRETALEVAKMRREQQAIQAQRQQAQQTEMETAQFHQAVAKAQQSLESYVQTRAHEIDHPARMKALETYFADPRKLQEFATTYQPHQWPTAIRMLYDNVQVAQPRRSGPAPISSRAASLGRPVTAASQQPEERIMSLIDNMGL
ncbi:hypothetical protein ACOTCG_28035 [Achromobacter xylosoxidans]